MSFFKKFMSFLYQLFKRAQEKAAAEENSAPLENAVVLEDNPAIPQTTPAETAPLDENREPYLDTEDQAPPAMGDNVMPPKNDPQVAVLTEEEVVALEVQPASMRAEILPQEFSRAEVNLLSFPFFALWDKDVHRRTETEYNAVIKRGDERLEVSWNVSCNPRYGYPGPFDRKVHRAIEHIISELRPPLENPVPIGSLYHIAKLANFGTSGKIYQDIKAAILRIISTTVESKGTFYHKDREKWVEDAFHIYDRAVFVGESLPGGQTADTNNP